MYASRRSRRQPKEHLDRRRDEFQAAMDRFEGSVLYDNSSICAFGIVGLQVVAAGSILHASLDPIVHALVFVLAVVVTDVWNGLLHMVLDNVTSYRSPLGPFVANFQLHHKHSGYRSAHPAVVYWNETGDKKWLLPFLVVALCMDPGPGRVLLLEVGILSSLAELAHYWSHADEVGPIVRWLQRRRCLISAEEHRRHHTEENTHYAFFTGWSNPVLDVIARALAPGYEGRKDQYAAAYQGKAGKRE